MKYRDKIVLGLILAGALGLATLGVVRAQTTSGDTQVTDSGTTTIATDPAPATKPGCQGRLDELATTFNMSTADLQKELQAGKPVYQIAAEHGVTYGTMKQKQLDQLKTKLDDMVKVGYLTQTEADQVYQQAQSQPSLGLGLGHHGGGWLK